MNKDINQLWTLTAFLIKIDLLVSSLVPRGRLRPSVVTGLQLTPGLHVIGYSIDPQGRAMVVRVPVKFSLVGPAHSRVGCAEFQTFEMRSREDLRAIATP